MSDRVTILDNDHPSLHERLVEAEERAKSLEVKLRRTNSELAKRKLRGAEIGKRIELLETELSLYREIGNISSGNVHLDLLLEHLMNIVLKALETTDGRVYLVNEDGSTLSPKVVKGPVPTAFEGMTVSMKEGVVGWVARTGKSYVAGDPEGHEKWGKDYKLLSSRRFSNIVAVPIKSHRRIAGVIEVIHTRRGGAPFSKRDVDVLSSLANHISIILDKGRMILELDNRLRQFSILYEVGSLLVSSLDQKAIRKMTMETMTRLMNAEAGSLLLLDETSGELYFEVALGIKGAKVKNVRLKRGEGIAGWVAEHGKPLIIHDVNNDPRFLRRVDKRTDFNTKNMACVPIKIKDKVVGVLQAINRLDGRFTEEEMDLFQLFSNEVAIALDNARLYEELRETFFTTAGALAEAIEKRDPYTGGHTKRVLKYSTAIAEQLNLQPREMETLKLSAVLHDIGKIGVEDKILKKTDKLSEDEMEVMNRHPKLGAEIVDHIKQLKDVIPAMLYHHEKVDGTGYPDGLKEDSIPLTARIIAVADTYDAMTTTRPYRKGLKPEVALDELKKEVGRQFDGEVVAAFVSAFENGCIRVRR
ncbi:MAG: GAF domain-containing protein [Zetaproteobacteria bacterium]|jgi:putative nucleotidyltransferase with HDIG domain|nr:GAF domain-containing protein [Zetaproteobacteria bacterium]